MPAVPVDDAWDVVAGLTLGQDVSDRLVQLTGTPPQFCLGKSFPAYGPIGPALVSVDAFADPDDIALWCDVGGERMQDGRAAADLLDPDARRLPVVDLHARTRRSHLHRDADGVGMARGRFLVEGDVVVSGAEGIGELRNRCVRRSTGR